MHFHSKSKYDHKNSKFHNFSQLWGEKMTRRATADICDHRVRLPVHVSISTCMWLWLVGNIGVVWGLWLFPVLEGSLVLFSWNYYCMGQFPWYMYWAYTVIMRKVFMLSKCKRVNFLLFQTLFNKDWSLYALLKEWNSLMESFVALWI